MHSSTGRIDLICNSRPPQTSDRSPTSHLFIFDLFIMAHDDDGMPHLTSSSEDESSDDDSDDLRRTEFFEKEPKRNIFQSGEFVRFHGLLHNTERNGERGVVIGYDWLAGRYAVSVCDNDGEKRLRVKAENLTLIRTSQRDLKLDTGIHYFLCISICPI